MISNAIPPAFIYIIGALIIPLIRVRWLKQAVLLLIPVLAFVDLLSMPGGTYWFYKFLGYDLIMGRVDKLSLCFGYIFVIISFIGMTYALHVKEDGQHVAAYFYVGSTLGVTFAGDVFTLFLFWEIMAVSSVFLIWYRGDRLALNAGFRYILVHIFGGCALLAGVIVYVSHTGSITFDYIGLESAGGGLILLGFIINAAVPPVHAWLADAYPEGTVTGSVFLSAFTTKSAVYVLLRCYPGTEILVWMGAIMTVYGVIFAILENDIRRLLAYHIISQVGYMVCGVGLGSDLALNGSVAHAFCHILYKALLFMGAGAVIHVTGLRRLTDMRGRDLYKQMPWAMTMYVIGGLSISAVPLFNGFISKTMIVAASGELHRPVIHLLIHLASIGTFLSVGLKLPYSAWFGRRFEGPREPIAGAKEPPLNMLIAMGMASFACIFTGVYPQVLYNILPWPVDYHPYTIPHVINALQMLTMTLLIFWLLVPKLATKETITLDLDWFYRMPARLLQYFCDVHLNGLRDYIQARLSRATAEAGDLSKNPFTAASVIADSMKLNVMPESDGKKAFAAQLAALKERVYDEDRYRTPIGWSVLLSVCFIFIFTLVYFISNA